MTELEMLTLAAKAAGIVIVRSRLDDKLQRDMLVQNSARNPNQPTGPWNPREDDGDALRLACKLHINVFIYDDETSTATNGVIAKNWGSIEANTRRAITLTAARIGKDMP